MAERKLVNQLWHEHLADDWNGKNVQRFSFSSPEPTETEIWLWLACAKCGTKRKFTVSQAMRVLLSRQASHILYGSTCEICGTKSKVALEWHEP